MKWNTYQDQENRAYSHILTTLFPEQTKTLPQILVWSVIFLLDLIAVVGGGFYFGLIPAGSRMGALLIFAVVGLFWLQGKLWGLLCKGVQKWKESRQISL